MSQAKPALPSVKDVMGVLKRWDIRSDVEAAILQFAALYAQDAVDDPVFYEFGKLIEARLNSQTHDVNEVNDHWRLVVILGLAFGPNVSDGDGWAEMMDIVIAAIWKLSAGTRYPKEYEIAGISLVFHIANSGDFVESADQLVAVISNDATTFPPLMMQTAATFRAQ